MNSGRNEKGRLYKRRNQLARQRNKRTTQRYFFLWKLRWILLITLLIPLVTYTVSIDMQVRKAFEGQQWAVPARVYARPLELYSGMKLSAKSLINELDAVGYRQTSTLKQAGEYKHKGKRVYVYTRPFSFWDQAEPSRKIEIRFTSDNTIAQLRTMKNNETMPLLRLEPQLISKIYPTHKEDRILVRVEEVPKRLLNSLLAIEDKRFYEHNGLSLRALARAMVANFKAGEWVQGGSTLTQQLIKNHYLTPERSLKRKVKEAIMALLLEWHYNKDQILEAYLNEVHLGQNGSHAIHGMGMGAWFYFNKPLEQLTLAESAMLAAIVRGASRYNPRKHPERVQNRRDLVLKLMLNQGRITQAEYTEAKNTPLTVTSTEPRSNSPYPAFLDLVREQLRRDYREKDLQSDGLQIFTTLDPNQQAFAETAMINQVKILEKADRKKPKKARRLKGKLTGALIVSSAENGEVLALVGSARPRFAGFNNALNALRPIGSLVKPAIYLAALEKNNTYSLLSKIDDSFFEWEDEKTGEIWKPRNYDGKEHGRVPLFKALGYSYNLATVHLGFDLGLEKVKKTLQRLGIEREFKAYPSMLLGGLSLTPLEVAQMYQTIASGGFRMPLRAIRAVLTHDNKPLNRYGILVEQRFDAAPIFLINHVLQQVIRGGTGKHTAKSMLPKNLRVAGKTGTTNNYRDSWFAGYSNNLSAVVWLGRGDNRSTGLSGSNGAMRVWADFISRSNPESLSQRLPNRVEWKWVKARNGSLIKKKGKVKIPIIH